MASVFIEHMGDGVTHLSPLDRLRVQISDTDYIEAFWSENDQSLVVRSSGWPTTLAVLPRVTNVIEIKLLAGKP